MTVIMAVCMQQWFLVRRGIRCKLITAQLRDNIQFIDHESEAKPTSVTLKWSHRAQDQNQ